MNTEKSFYPPIETTLPPPPSYGESNNDGSLRMLYHDRGPLQPFQPWSNLSHLYWTTNDFDVAFDIQCEEIPGKWSSKFPIYRCNAGERPPAFVYNQTMNTLRNEDNGTKMKCDFKRLKNNQSTSLDFKYNNLNLKWNSNQPLSSMFGNTYDTTHYVCSDANGTQLATFSFLSPHGQLDTRIRLTHAGSAVLPIEIALVTFSILFIEQWGDMRREVRNNLMAERIPTLRNVQANFSQGRLITYALNSFEHIEQLIGEIEVEADRRDVEAAKRHRTTDTSGTAGVVASVSSCC